MGKKERERARKRQELNHPALNIPIIPPGSFEYTAIAWVRRNNQKAEDVLGRYKHQLEQEGFPITRVSIACCGVYSLFNAFHDEFQGRYAHRFIEDFTKGGNLVASALMNSERTLMGLSQEDFNEEINKFVGLTEQEKQEDHKMTQDLLGDLAVEINKDPTGFSAVDRLDVVLADPNSPWVENITTREFFVRGVNFAVMLYKEFYPRTEGLKLS